MTRKNILLLVLSIMLLACSEQSQNSFSKELNETHEGYLEEEDIPKSLNIVPSPPIEGSEEYDLDKEVALKYAEFKDTARIQQAKKDEVLSFPEAIEAFNIILNVNITTETTPTLYILMRRTLVDVVLSVYSAKNYYKRERPFMVNKKPTCTPDDEELLRKDGSYPSGHAAIGWTWALILAEVFPEQSEEILKRGKEFGISRTVCNVHWHSDIVAGRIMGDATVDKLNANTDFIIDLETVKEEVSIIKKQLSE